MPSRRHTGSDPPPEETAVRREGSATGATFSIDLDGTILYIDRQVSPGTHGEAVAAKLADLGVARRPARSGN